MTILEAITMLDDLKPNQYEQNKKVHWLSTIDGRVYNEIIAHMDNPPIDSWTPYDEYADLSTELIVGDPYSELYIQYMAAQVDWWNGEFARYNNEMDAFNEGFRAFTDYYRNTHHIADGKVRKFVL